MPTSIRKFLQPGTKWPIQGRINGKWCIPVLFFMLLMPSYFSGLTGCRSDSSFSPTPTPPPPPPPQALTKADFFEDGFLDVQSTYPYAALPAPAEPYVGYGFIRFGGSYENGYWGTQLLLRAAEDADTVTVDFHKPNGQPLRVNIEGYSEHTTVTLNLAKGTSETLNLLRHGENTLLLPDTVGYAVIRHHNPNTRASIVHRRLNNFDAILSTLVSPATRHLISEARIVILDGAKEATGFTILNPGAVPCTATFTLRRYDGTILETAERNYLSGQFDASYFFQFSEFTNTLSTAFDGTMEISASKPVVLTAMSNTADHFTHFRPHPVADTQEPVTEFLYTHAPVNPDTRSYFELHTGNNDTVFNIWFFNPDGSARTIRTERFGADSEFTIHVPANNLDLFVPGDQDIDGNPVDTDGYAAITTDQPDARAVLYHHTGNGQEICLEPAMPVTGQGFDIEKNQESEIELALLNFSDDPLDLNLYLTDIDGIVEAGDGITLPAHEQVVRKLGEFPGLQNLIDSSYTGTFHLVSTNGTAFAANVVEQELPAGYRTPLASSLGRFGLTFHLPGSCSSLSLCISAIYERDRLIIGDGTYGDSVQDVRSDTIIEAEHDGKVQFTGGFNPGSAGFTMRGIVVNNSGQKDLGSGNAYRRMSFVGGPSCGNTFNSIMGSDTKIYESAFYGPGGRYLLLAYRQNGGIELNNVIFRPDGGWGQDTDCNEWEPHGAYAMYDTEGFDITGAVVVDAVSDASSTSECLGGQIVNTHLSHGDVGTIRQSVITASENFGRFASEGLGSHNLTIVDSVSRANGFEWGLTRNCNGTTTATRFDSDQRVEAWKGSISFTAGTNLVLDRSFLNDPRWKREMCTDAGVDRGFCGTAMDLGDYVADRLEVVP